MEFNFSVSNKHRVKRVKNFLIFSATQKRARRFPTLEERVAEARSTTRIVLRRRTNTYRWKVKPTRNFTLVDWDSFYFKFYKFLKRRLIRELRILLRRFKKIKIKVEISVSNPFKRDLNHEDFELEFEFTDETTLDANFLKEIDSYTEWYTNFHYCSVWPKDYPGLHPFGNFQVDWQWEPDGCNRF